MSLERTCPARRTLGVSSSSSASWHAEQGAYWDSLASNYDSLYRGAWSQLENDLFRRRLAAVAPRTAFKALDLGCGTGLALRLLSDVRANFTYTGLDISREMVLVARALHPNASFCQGSMDNLSGVRPGGFDLVLASFSALSYSACPACTVEGAAAAAARGGTVMLSALSAHSLRRLSRLRRGKSEVYRTRGQLDGNGTMAWALTPDQLRRTAASAGLSNIRVVGEGALAGVAERPMLWSLSASLARIWPALCHCILVIADSSGSSRTVPATFHKGFNCERLSRLRA